MATKISMPKLSDTMEEGLLVKWLKQEGDAIEAGEIIAEVESDKANMELEAYDSGILRKLVVKEGDKIKVGGLMAIIGERGEDIEPLLSEPELKVEPEPERETEAVKTVATRPTEKSDVVLEKPTVVTDTRIKASPLARKLASEQGIDLQHLTGSGPAGRIVKRDVLDFAKAKRPTVTGAKSLVGKEIELSMMRQTIADRMTQSKTTVPHFYLTMEIDMGSAMVFRKSINELNENTKISYNDLVIKAVAIALTTHPYVNASFAGDKIIFHEQVDIGVAVALEDGLITPVIRSCSGKSIGQISKEANELAARAKDRKLTPEEYTGSTFTISNLGMFGIEEFSAIINPPEAAILAVGALQEKPVVKDGQVTVGHRMKVTLSCDHRVVDGATGALFLLDLKKLLENPIGLVM